MSHRCHVSTTFVTDRYAYQLRAFQGNRRRLRHSAPLLERGLIRIAGHIRGSHRHGHGVKASLSSCDPSSWSSARPVLGVNGSRNAGAFDADRAGCPLPRATGPSSVNATPVAFTSRRSAIASGRRVTSTHERYRTEFSNIRDTLSVVKSLGVTTMPTA